jgi:hypothetical protein
MTYSFLNKSDMKFTRSGALLLTAAFACVLISCNASRKSGCPSNGKNVGAERLLNGEKVPKAKKFKA